MVQVAPQNRRLPWRERLQPHSLHWQGCARLSRSTGAMNLRARDGRSCKNSATMQWRRGECGGHGAGGCATAGGVETFATRKVITERHGHDAIIFSSSKYDRVLLLAVSASVCMHQRQAVHAQRRHLLLAPSSFHLC